MAGKSNIVTPVAIKTTIKPKPPKINFVRLLMIFFFKINKKNYPHLNIASFFLPINTQPTFFLLFFKRLHYLRIALYF
jgi:hypothetical protein